MVSNTVEQVYHGWRGSCANTFTAVLKIMMYSNGILCDFAALGSFSAVFGMDWKEKTSRDFMKVKMTHVLLYVWRWWVSNLPDEWSCMRIWLCWLVVHRPPGFKPVM